MTSILPIRILKREPGHWFRCRRLFLTAKTKRTGPETGRMRLGKLSFLLAAGLFKAGLAFFVAEEEGLRADTGSGRSRTARAGAATCSALPENEPIPFFRPQVGRRLGHNRRRWRRTFFNLAWRPSLTVHSDYQAHCIHRHTALIVRRYGLLHAMVVLALRVRPELEPAQVVAFESAMYLDCARLLRRNLQTMV
jgi:hypothetical protein